MKKLIPVFALLFLSFGLSAQYKKAGYFGKSGRTYELGTKMYMMGKGNGSPIGYKFALGSDGDGDRLFFSWSFQYIPSHKYSYSTVDDMGAAVNISGSSKSSLLYGWDFGYHLLKNDGAHKPLFQPFMSAGFNVVLLGGFKNEIESPETVYFHKRNTATETFSMGINGGLGCLVNLSPKWGLKAEGGYNAQANVSGNNWDDEIKPFYMFTSHTYASIGVRLRIVTESE